jgi:hypothetical protein
MVYAAKDHFAPGPLNEEVFSTDIFDEVSMAFTISMMEEYDAFTKRKLTKGRYGLDGAAMMHAGMLVRVISVLTGCRQYEVSGAKLKDLAWTKSRSGRYTWKVSFRTAKTAASEQMISFTFPDELAQHFQYLLVFLCLF